MRYMFVARLLTVLLAISFGCLSSRGQTTPPTPLTNASVVKLVKAGFKEKSILSIIAARPARFDLSTERMIELKRSGVSERIILAMLARQEGMDIDLSDDSWGDDPFFAEGIDPKKNNSTRNPSSGNPSSGSPSSGDGSSADIFGSSGGVKGETRTRGGVDGSLSGDTITTGSATVRIIKPPAEANAPMKLEKTPSLTNASIIELVEAGFSEGTIIRRIEQSPVEFDLSANQMAELRKHRVSEKILAAMRAATGDDAAATKNSPRSDVKP
jgi:hypothetical protein